MPLTRRQRLAYRLTNRDPVKRHIFTLALPAIIGRALFRYALYTGFAPAPLVGPSAVATSAAASQAAAKLEAYQQIVAEQNPGSNTTVKATAVATPHPEDIHNFDLVVTVSLWVGLGPFAL